MKPLAYYLNLPYHISISPEASTNGSLCYVARLAELPGCESHGQHPEEALQNLQEAKELYISSLLEDGFEPPEPTVSLASSAQS